MSAVSRKGEALNFDRNKVCWVKLKKLMVGKMYKDSRTEMKAD